MKKRFKSTVRWGNGCTHAVREVHIWPETFCGRARAAERVVSGEVDCRACIRAMAAMAKAKSAA